MTKAKLTKSRLPSNVGTKEEIPWSIGIETTGSGEDYIGGGLWARPVSQGDNPVDRAAFIITDKQGNPVKIPPGKSISGTLKIPPLNQWMSTVPDTLKWSTLVGWLEKSDDTFGLHATDRKDHTVSVKKGAGGIFQWIKNHPEIVVAGTVATGAVVTYSQIE